MQTQTLVKSAPQSQVNTPCTWDEPTALAQVNDYICKPFTPVMQVIEKDVLADGQVRLLVKPVSASITEEWFLEAEQLQQPQQTSTEEDAPQPTGYAGDSVSCQLRPSPVAAVECEQGYYHGRRDADQRLHPMYAEATCDYTKSYLEGYWNRFNSSQKTRQQQLNKQPHWRVLLDPCDHQLYQVWISDRCLGEKASTIEEAERIAIQYVTTDKLIKRQNAAVMAASAGI